MARSYHMSQIPGLARKIRAVVDWTVGLPFAAIPPRSARSATREPLTDEVYAHGGTHRPVAGLRPWPVAHTWPSR